VAAILYGKNQLAGDIEVTKFSDLSKKILPFFFKYPIEGVKSKDLFDFCSVAELIKNKAHLTKEGLEAIRKIKKGMNKYRSLPSQDLEEETYQDLEEGTYQGLEEGK
jgi:hypothetical protein